MALDDRYRDVRFQSTLLMRGATCWISSDRLTTISFQSTLLMRGATGITDYELLDRVYFNPRSSCEERPELQNPLSTSLSISIHAPHARSDSDHPAHDPCRNISIHAPHARSDSQQSLPAAPSRIFQSTLLMRGATATAFAKKQALVKFQSTLLMRGATTFLLCGSARRYNFNPRSSCEERPSIRFIAYCFNLFQSTLLMRGATPYSARRLCRQIISIHAPHARSDAVRCVCRRFGSISIHAPHARSDGAA